MKKIKQAIGLTLCAALLVCASVMGTMAYLQSTSGPVTNTMKVGMISITLDEAEVNEYGEAIAGADRVAGNNTPANTYKLIPGRTYTKDPTIHVAKGSEPCYLFVEVVNGISAIETTEEGKPISAQMAANGWIQIENTNYWYHKDIVDARSEQKDMFVFSEFTIAGSVTGDTLNGIPNGTNYANAKILITAYAVQADGFTDALAAWAATYGAPTTSN